MAIVGAARALDRDDRREGGEDEDEDIPDQLRGAAEAGGLVDARALVGVGLGAVARAVVEGARQLERVAMHKALDPPPASDALAKLAFAWIALAALAVAANVDGDPAAAGPVGLTGYAAATLFWKELRRSLPLPCLSFSFRPATVKLSRPWCFQRWLFFASLTPASSPRRS